MSELIETKNKYNLRTNDQLRLLHDGGDLYFSISYIDIDNDSVRLEKSSDQVDDSFIVRFQSLSEINSMIDMDFSILKMFGVRRNSAGFDDNFNQFYKFLKDCHGLDKYIPVHMLPAMFNDFKIETGKCGKFAVVTEKKSLYTGMTIMCIDKYMETEEGVNYHFSLRGTEYEDRVSTYLWGHQVSFIQNKES